MNELRTAIRSSRLGVPGSGDIPIGAGVDELCHIFDDELRVIADRLAPARQAPVTVRRRPLDVWFNQDSRSVDGYKYAVCAAESLSNCCKTRALKNMDCFAILNGHFDWQYFAKL